MKTCSPLRLSLTVLLVGLCGATAHAGVAPATPDRSAVQAAEGGFVLADGRTLSLRLRSTGVEVNLNEEIVERWRIESETVLVSPDRRQRLHLHRDANGMVDRVSLESPRAR